MFTILTITCALYRHYEGENVMLYDVGITDMAKTIHSTFTGLKKYGVLCLLRNFIQFYRTVSL